MNQTEVVSSLRRKRVLLMGTLFFAVLSWTGSRSSTFNVAVAQQQKGKASYYSKRATGARTASGLRLHHDSMTCAHRTFPFGTLLKVTNLINGKTVVVKVTDRGPYGRGWIIDLSWGAAKAIDMLAQGVVPVIVERVKTTIYPFRPEMDSLELPELDFEIADIANGITPVWQEMALDSERVVRQMSKIIRRENPSNTVLQEAPVRRQNGVSPSSSPPPGMSRQPVAF